MMTMEEFSDFVWLSLCKNSLQQENAHLREIIEQFCMDADNYRHAYWRPRTNAIQIKKMMETREWYAARRRDKV